MQEECKLLGHYIDIMKIRNEIPLELEVDLEKDTEKLIVPKLILQPLVENAIVHGLVDHPAPRIVVRSRTVPDGIMIEVEDNGCGAGAEVLAGLNRRLLYKDDEQDEAYQRVGLMNVVQRLRLTYGQDTRLSLHNLPQGGVSVSLYLPQGNHQVNLSEREGY